MVRIHVFRPFSLNLSRGALEFAEGLHLVDREIAGHWYAAAHSKILDEPETESVQDSVEQPSRRRGRPRKS